MTSADDRDDRAPDAPGLASSAVGLLTREASRVPLVALTLGLQAWERTRGVREMAVRRGSEALQIAAHTPLGRFLPQPVMDDDAQAEAVEIAAGAARETADRARETIDSARREAQAAPATDTGAATAKPATGTRAATAKPATGTRAATAKPATGTRAATAKPATGTRAATAKPATGTRAATAKPATGTGAASTAAPAAPQEAVQAGAPGVATERVEQVTEQLDLAEPTSRADLPIADFDNISLGSLRGRLRSLSLEQLVTLREWEQAHAHRLPVVTLLDNRIAKVSAEQATAYPADSGGGSTRGTGSGTGSGTAGPTSPRGKAAAAGAKKAAKDEGGTLRV